MIRGCIIALVLLAALVSIGMKPEDEPRYLSPTELAISPDSQRLYVVCERGDQLLVVETSTSTVIKRVPVGHMPRGVGISADGRQIYVANSSTDTVSVIDAEKLEVAATIRTGFEPISVVPDRRGETLYVANRLSSDISVIDLASGKEIKRLSSGRGASYLGISSDGTQVLASHIYPRIGEVRTPPESEVTVIDTASRRVIERRNIHNVAGVFHMALSSDSTLGFAAQLRPKNLIPLAHVEHGWAFGDSLALFGKNIDGVVQVPLDELERYAAMPFGVALTPDNVQLFVSAAGSDNIVVIDVPALMNFIRDAKKPFANDLSASANYVTARVPVGHNPRGIALSPDGKSLYVANRMDDTISVLDTKSVRVINTIDLGGSKHLTPSRLGERNFNNARFSFQGQYSCSNCHLDATFDGLQWDLEPDGFGVDVVDNRPIYNLLGTQPFKWNGGNPDLPTECGPRTEKYFYRSQSFNEKELTDLVAYLVSLPAPPSRYRLQDGGLTPAQERGKVIFERIKSKSGQPIPESNRCGTCHSGPKYTNNKSEDVGTGKPIDRSPLVDTPHLPGIAYSAPYLHDGSARSLEEIWTVFNPKDQHGVTNDLTKDELNDLIEYLRTL